MKKYFLHIWFILLASHGLWAQEDSIAQAPEIQLKEGVYLSLSDLQTNNPLPKENISMPGDKTQLEYISKTLNDNKEFYFTYKGSQYRAETQNVWGFCQNGTVHVNFKGKFCRVPLFGSISHFFATVIVTTYVSNYGGYGGGFYGGMGGMGMGPSVPVKQQETRQFLLDFKTGDIFDFTPTNLETLLSRDMRIYNQYMSLKRKKRKELMIMYIRKYNAEHPIHFLPVPTGK